MPNRSLITFFGRISWIAILVFLFWTRTVISLAATRVKPLRQRTNNPLSIEKDLIRCKDITHVIGSDEAGRGCIAGPVAAASVAIVDPAHYEPIPGVDDSKNLSHEMRLQIYEQVKRRTDTYVWSIATKTPEEIDQLNIEKATLMALGDSLEQTAAQIVAMDEDSCIYGIVDGKKSPKTTMPSRPYVQGDAIVYSVALASILARVTHERLMKEKAKQYPGYKLEQNLGYPSSDHIEAIHEHGPVAGLHRMTCKPVQRHNNSQSRKNFIASLMFPLLLPAVLRPDDAAATYTDGKTGNSLPEAGEIEASVPSDWHGIDNPLAGDTNSLLSRLDSSQDSIFYTNPRFVEHVDEQAVQILTKYVTDEAVPSANLNVLDLCSSWTSHLDRQVQHAVGIGMNAKELEANPQLTEWAVQDLNDDPKLNYKDDTYDVVLCQLSIDYLTRPQEVCGEMARVLKPGGKVHILFSNRLFLSKAVALWTGADDIDHAFTVASYLHFGGGFERIQARDLSIRKKSRIVGDPVYVVTATKI